MKGRIGEGSEFSQISAISATEAFMWPRIHSALKHTVPMLV